MKGSKGMCHCSSIESKIEKQASTTTLPKFSTTNPINENTIVFAKESLKKIHVLNIRKGKNAINPKVFH